MTRSGASLLVLLGMLLSTSASADRDDRSRPIYLEAAHVEIDDAKQMSVFTGNVVLTQGTMVMRGEQIVVVQDKEGFKHGTATGNLASFRQKREGRDDYVEGYGERIEYDTRSEIMDIYGHAHVKRGQEDVRGDHITYNSKTESFKVSGSPESPAQEQEQRVRVVIQPPTAASAPPAVEPLSIKPATTLTKPEENKP